MRRGVKVAREASRVDQRIVEGAQHCFIALGERPGGAERELLLMQHLLALLAEDGRAGNFRRRAKTFGESCEMAVGTAGTVGPAALSNVKTAKLYRSAASAFPALPPGPKESVAPGVTVI